MKKIINFAALSLSLVFLSGCGQVQNPGSQNPTAAPKPQSNVQPIAKPDISQSQSTNNSNSNNNTMELKIETTQPGTGDRTVKAGDTVFVQYTGKLTDGTKFDSSLDHGGKPFSFQVGAGQVIKGWDQGLLGAKVGEKRTLTIPASLGYGTAGAGGVIPPNATLIFDIEVVSIQ